MQCRELRDLADAFIGEELLVETNHEILRHLASCPDCSADIAARRALRSRLKSAFAAADDLAPRPEWLSGLGDRLHAGALPQSRTRTVATRWLALAAMLILMVGAGGFVLSGSRGRAVLLEMARAAVGDHRNCAVRFALAEKPISLERAAAEYDPVYRAFETIPSATVAARRGSVEVVERHSCVFEGRRYAHVVMKYQGELVSLLITADAAGSLTRLPASHETGDSLPAAEGYNVVYQHAGRHLVFIVGSGAPDALRDVADAIGADVAARLGAA